MQERYLKSIIGMSQDWEQHQDQDRILKTKIVVQWRWYHQNVAQEGALNNIKIICVMIYNDTK